MAQLRTDAPSILYKFRSNIQRDVQCLLVDRQLYLPSPLELNDPFDCYPVLAPPPLYKHSAFIEESVAQAPRGKTADARGRAELLLYSQSHRERFLEEFYRLDLSQLGILSLSAGRDHPLLWSHYAGNASGFVVGYRGIDAGTLKAVPAAPVSYKTKRPAMWVLDNADGLAWHTLLSTKSRPWSYEQEWRYIRMASQGGKGTMIVPVGSIVEVCLGPRMTEQDRLIVTRAAQALADRPRILQARLMPSRFGMTFHAIP